MNILRNSIVTSLCFLFTSINIFGQNQFSQRTQVEVGYGIVFPYLKNGNELMDSKKIRDLGQSYYENANEQRQNVGKYSRQQGWSLAMAFYKPIKKVTGLMIGGAVRNALTNSTPENGGYAEGYYFNFLTAAAAIKYYPFSKNNTYLKSEFGMGSVWTKNRFIDENGKQSFFHQFGIGTGFVLGLGYSIKPFKTNDLAIDLSIIYHLLKTRVEVNNIGDDQWSFNALNFQFAINF